MLLNVTDNGLWSQRSAASRQCVASAACSSHYVGLSEKRNNVRAHEKCIFIKNRMRNDRQLLAACCTQLAVPLRYFLNIRLSCHHSAPSLSPSPSLHLPLAFCAKVINRNAWIMQFSCLHLRGQLTKKRLTTMRCI